MTTKGQNFEVYQGDNKEIIITIRNQDGSLTNLTGYSAVWCVHSQTISNIVLQKTTLPLGGIEVPDPASGQLIITLSSVDTSTLATKNYGHQCEIEDNFGNHSTVTTGYIQILRSITHPEL
jgi:hypothetical protein